MTTQRLSFRFNHFQLGTDAWKFIGAGIVIAILSILCVVYCAPYVYLITTSLKSNGQISEPSNPLLPSDVATFQYKGQTLELYTVPIDAHNKTLALLKPGRTSATYIDPQHPD